MTQLDLEQCVFTACLWEATARKAGNVHRYRDFENLTYLDFIQSAHAIAPVIASMVDAPIGETVLECIKATRKVVSTNTNLGIVLLLVPLSKAETLDYMSVWEVLKQTTVNDSKLVYEAIRLAQPGGLGKVSEQDISQNPTEKLLKVMERAAEYDTIARFYAENFEYPLYDWGKYGWLFNDDPIELSICELQIEVLSLYPDSLIRRKAGEKVAEQISRRARTANKYDSLKSIRGREAYGKFAAYLNAKSTDYNPGTTADIVTTFLFVWLRSNKIDLNRPFTWKEYPG